MPRRIGMQYAAKQIGLMDWYHRRARYVSLERTTRQSNRS